MKLTLTYLFIFACITALQVLSQNQPVPPIFTNQATSFKYNTNQNNGNQCAFRCTRRAIQDWSQGDWNLYLQLYLAFDRRGWAEQFATEHNYDCNGRPCLFHQGKNFLSWHRFYLAHYEQLLQRIDRQINPGRAQRFGEFCIGYWDWGYQAPFSNNFQDQVYRYLFGPQALGTLVNGNIPDGQLRNVQSPPNSGNFLTRCPSLGSNNWDNSAIAACIALRDIEGDGDASVGFRPCFEYNAHNAVHNSLGCGMASFLAPRDPLFFLHHGMIDYVWWLWEQNWQTNIIPNGWDGPVPRTYSQWRLYDSFNERNFCYTYARPRSVSGRRLSMRKDLQYKTPSTTKVPAQVSQLDLVEKIVVTKVLDSSTPQPIPYENFMFLRMHAGSEAEGMKIYKEHVKAVGLAQKLHWSIKNFYQGKQDLISSSYMMNVTTTLPSSAASDKSNSTTQELVSTYIKALTTNL